MQRPMVSFVEDEHGDWVALLACGHRQHVRRPWVTTAAGRASKLGALLDCRLCEEEHA
jgi:hypothetical protein